MNHMKLKSDSSMINRYLNILKQYTTQECIMAQLEQPMQELGINSFCAMEIMIAAEKEFDIVFPDSMISPDLFQSPKTLWDGLLTVIDENHNK